MTTASELLLDIVDGDIRFKLFGTPHDTYELWMLVGSAGLKIPINMIPTIQAGLIFIKAEIESGIHENGEVNE